MSWLTLRRTYSPWAHEKGVLRKVIAQLMGDAKIDTTLDVYTQVVDGSLRKAADGRGIRIVHYCSQTAVAVSQPLRDWLTSEQLSQLLALGLWPAKGHENPLRENSAGSDEVELSQWSR